MSSTDPMRDVFSIRSETMRNLSLRPSRFLQMQNTKSSSLMKLDNTSNDVQLLLRAFIEEFAGNCRFIFTCNYKNKILEPSTPDVPSLSLESKEKIVKPLPPSSSSDSEKSWMQKVLNMITRSW